MLCAPLMMCWLVASLPFVTQLAAEHPPIRGLQGVAVVGEGTATELRGYGIDDDWLRDRAVRELERARVPLVSKTDAFSSAHQPVLAVRLQTQRLPGTRTFAWNLSLTLYRRMATLSTPPDTALCQAWVSTATFGATSGLLLAGSVDETLELKVREFASAWRSASR